MFLNEIDHSAKVKELEKDMKNKWAWRWFESSVKLGEKNYKLTQIFQKRE